VSNNLQKAILSTLIYADLFDYPLTREEIVTWLIDYRINGPARRRYASSVAGGLTDYRIDKELLELKKQKKIGNIGAYYYLVGRPEIVKIRQKREDWSREKIKLAENIAEIMRRIPFVKMIAISGGLASLNSEKNDDIDFFVIVSKNRLFTARALIVLILKAMGKYRSQDRITNMICPNMFLSEDSLKIEPEDLYLAHEILLAKPLINKDKTYEKFIQANKWVKKYLPNRFQEFGFKEKIEPISEAPVFIISGILDFKETFLRWFQLWYMNPKRTTETISSKILKFHPQDVRIKVLERFKLKSKRFF